MHRQLEFAAATWNQVAGPIRGMKTNDAKWLKELEIENARLKKLVAEAELDKAMLKELAEGKLVTPNRRHRAVETLQLLFGVSERRAGAVVGQHRSTQRLVAPAPPDDELALRAFLRAFSTTRPRWGWRVNDKRIQRLWRSEGLKAPHRQAREAAPRYRHRH
jgi:hypothetical protein